jgi:hypothetical protein
MELDGRPRPVEVRKETWSNRTGFLALLLLQFIWSRVRSPSTSRLWIPTPYLVAEVSHLRIELTPTNRHYCSQI